MSSDWWKILEIGFVSVSLNFGRSGFREKAPVAKRNDTSVKIDADVARKAKVLCSLDDITIAEYLTGILRPVVERDYADRIKKAANEQVKK